MKSTKIFNIIIALDHDSKPSIGKGLVVNPSLSPTMSTSLNAALVTQPVAPTPIAVAKVRALKGNICISSHGDIKLLPEHISCYNIMLVRALSLACFAS